MDREILTIVLFGFQVLLSMIGGIALIMLKNSGRRLQNIEEKVTQTNGRVAKLETWKDEHVRSSAEWKTAHLQGETDWRSERVEHFNDWKDQHTKLEDERNQRAIGHYEKLWNEFKNLLDVKAILQNVIQELREHK